MIEGYKIVLLYHDTLKKYHLIVISYVINVGDMAGGNVHGVRLIATILDLSGNFSSKNF